MKTLPILALTGFLGLLAVAEVAAESCNVPPSNALSLAATKDSKWRARWCGNQSLSDTLWNGLSLAKSDWDGGWGWEDVCNDNRFLSRVLNAASIVREVQQIATHFPEPNSPNFGHKWWDFVKEKEDDGFEPQCCNDNLNPSKCCLWATHYCCATSSDLCVAWGFNRGAADRSTTLVHEATHEDEGHISDSDCANGGSCDTYYGAYNANTMQINYMYDAMAAYEIETVGGKVQRRVGVYTSGGNQMCAFVPLLESSERSTLISDVMTRLNRNFKSGSVFPNYANVAAIDSAQGTPWPCAGCSPAAYTFSAATFGKNKACNEITNKANVQVNAANRAACQAMNAGIGTASGAGAYGKLQTEFYRRTTGKCEGCTTEDTAAYCNTRKSAAATVADLDPLGMLSSCGYWAESDCAESYCQAKYDPSWKSHANDPAWDDPRGCLDLLCGDDAKCRKRFLVYGGKAEFYDPATCFETYLECKEAKGEEAPGAVADPSTVRKPSSKLAEMAKTRSGASITAPKKGVLAYDMARKASGVIVVDDCRKAQETCEQIHAVAKRLSAYRFAKKIGPPIPEPDPWARRTNPWMNPPSKAFEARIRSLQAQFAAGKIGQKELDRQFEHLMGRRESMAAAYSLEPSTFVGIFGKQGMERIVGPSIRSVKPKALSERDFDVRARPYLKELNGLKLKANATQLKKIAPAR